MAKKMTFLQAKDRFVGLATVGITIAAAIQEAVDRIYEMGRWPGTTVEVELQDVDFVEDVDLNHFYLYFVEQTYAGAIGFRNANRGWAIVDQMSLYKDGTNMGDREFVDYGTVTVEGVEKRKYRCPLGWTTDGGPYFVLLKLEAPTLVDATLISVESMGAFKCAIRAVCCEYVNDDDRAMLNWQEFDQFMTSSARQVAGPKRYTMGMDSSLRRKPQQFY